MLKAHLALHEIERTALSAEINDSNTTPERRAEAIARRDAALVEWGEIMSELDSSYDISAMDQLPE
jgi:hypothetical protein